jgi:hypothetical protein
MTDVTFDALPSQPAKMKPLRPKRDLAARASADQASSHMLRLFRANLEVRLRTIDAASLQSECQKKIYADVAEMLAAQPGNDARNAGWDEMYKAESMMGLLLTGAELREEIGCRLEQLSGVSLAEAEALRRDYEKLLKPPAGGEAAPSDSLLRNFLLRVMEAIHWNSKKKYLARPIRKAATKKILICVLISFLLLIAPYAYLTFDFHTIADADGGVARHAGVSRVWTLFTLYTALTAGLLGAFFSRLIRVQGSWDNMALEEVFLHRELSYTLLRAGVGMCGALIVYFFLRSGIAAGALFPEFKTLRIDFIDVNDFIDATRDKAVSMSFVMPSPALALLTFWSFLAGFSERLVPGILSGTEKQLGDAAAGQTAQK